MTRVVLAVVLGLVAMAACAAGQDPGITPVSSDSTATTSRTLAACPPGGPDSTTSPAGCLAGDGSVQRP